MKKLLLLFTLFCVSLSSWAYDFTVDGIYYHICNYNPATNEYSVNFVEVTYKSEYYEYSTDDYTGSITIPSTVTYRGITYPVKGIGKSAFMNCTGLTSIAIPSTITYIYNAAFYNCSSLTSVTIPSSVTSIGYKAFYRTALISLIIPSSVISMDAEAFSECHNLTSITIDSNCIPKFHDLKKLRSVTIGGNVNKIPDDVFLGCKNITSFTIPNSVTSIGNEAFKNTGLTSVIIPTSVTSIGDEAFKDCIQLTSLTIPASVKIGKEAFKNCFSITNTNLQNYPKTLNDNDRTMSNIINYSYDFSLNDYYFINKNIWSYYSDKMSEYDTDLKRKVYSQSQEYKHYDSIYNTTCQNFNKCLKYFILTDYSISDYNIESKTFKITYGSIGQATSDHPYPKNYFSGHYGAFVLKYLPTTTTIAKSFVNMNGNKTFKDIKSYFKISVNEEVASRIERYTSNIRIIFIFNNVNSVKRYDTLGYGEDRGRFLWVYEIGRVKMVIFDKITGEIYYQKIYEPIKAK